MTPGSIVHIGNEKYDTNLKLIRYNNIEYSEEELNESIETIKEPYQGVKWIQVRGISNENAVEEVGGKFDLTPLLLEDIVNTNSRPKLEEYDEYIFIIVKLLDFEKEKQRVTSQQISIVLGSDYIMSFSETETKVFETVKKRITAPKSLVREKSVDYLAYTIIDCIVDNYFEVLENIEDSMDLLEDQLINKPNKETLRGIYELKKEIILLRKSIWPLREVLNDMQSGKLGIVEENTEMYLRDVYDHVIQVIDTTQLFVDIVTGMLDTYLSSINNRMSEVMKILTIFSAIFIPITFLAGVFGMNFDYMPELRIKWAYPLFWVVVLTLTSSMLMYFKKKDWF